MVDGVSLLGVSIHGRPPIGSVYLPLRTGVSVLYGLNGAGKSAILDSLYSAFTGLAPHEGRIELHVRVPDLANIEWPATSLIRALFDACASTLLARWLDKFRESVPFDVSYRSNFQKVVDSMPTVYSFKNELEEVGKECSRQGLFTLEPSGIDEPAWNVNVSGQLGEGTPALLRGLEEVVAYDARRRLTNLLYLDSGSVSQEEWKELRQLLGLEDLPETPPTSASEVQGVLRRELEQEPYPVFYGTSVGRSDAQLALSRPEVPVPIFPCGSVERPEAIPRLLYESQLDVDQATLDWLRFDDEGRDRRIVVAIERSDVRLTERLRERIPAIAEEASRLAETLLMDSPEARLVMDHPDTWLHHPPLRWVALDAPSGRWVSLSSLSEAQARWVTLAASMALVGEGKHQRVAIVLIDEPEAALHARAERYMVRGLKHIAETLEATVIVATHSAQLLNDPDLHLTHVFRDSTGRTTVQVMDTPLRRELGAEPLGLSPADLLQLYRVFLLVEGSHDEVVLDVLVGDLLEQARTLVLPIRGARNLGSAIESQLLFDFTDATVVIALDGIEARRVLPIWEQSLELHARGRIEEAIAVLRRIRRPRTQEAELLYAFCRRALETGKSNRIRIFGFEEPDIIHYLPVQSFVPSASSWRDLVEQWDRKRPFKAWLRESMRADVSVAAMRRAAETMDEVPPQFIELAALGDQASRTARGLDR
jgi:ABC-type hemin transport system ATPase subunit